jgi:hypothetical protein
VTFARGQSIVVQSVEKRGAWYYFILEGGGELGVPVNRVATIEDYEPPPVSAVAAAPVAPAVPAVSPEPQQTAAGNPAVPAAGGQQAGPGSTPPAPQPNVVEQGEDDWRYKIRGGPKRLAPNLYGSGGAGASVLPGKKVPPGGQRPNPAQSGQQTP